MPNKAGLAVPPPPLLTRLKRALARSALPCPSFSSSILTRFGAFLSVTAMAPQLDTAQRILIKTLLAQGFETRLIASKTSCTVRTVQRIRLERQQSKTSNRRTRVGRRGCITPTMRKALCDSLTKQPYLYRYEMADFLFSKIWEKDIGKIDRSNPAINWLDEKNDPSHRTTTGCRPSRSLST
jgi:hypothetical protein